jgi:ketosteroid isomerase-like protein
MSEANVETVRRFLEAAAADDLAACLACLHPELEWIPMRVGTEGAFRGHEGFERFRDDTWEHYDSFEARYELLDLDERGVLGWGAVYVRGKGSGLQMEVPSAGVFEFRDGLIARWRDFGTRERALQLGGAGREP